MIRSAKYEQHFNSFFTLYIIVVPTKNLSKCFYLLSNISKDADFHALSDYIIISVIAFVYSHNNFEKEMKKNKKYRSDKFDAGRAFSMLIIFSIK